MASMAAQDIATVPLAPPPSPPQTSDLTAASAATAGSSGVGTGNVLPTGAASHSQGGSQQQRPLRQTTLWHGAAGDVKASVRADAADAAASIAPGVGAAAGSRAAGRSVSGGGNTAAAPQSSEMLQTEMEEPTHVALDEDRAQLNADRASRC
jgi:hypothetical protein